MDHLNELGNTQTMSLIDESYAFVKAQFEKVQSKNELLYHNWDHTKFVYNSAMRITDNSEVSEQEREWIAIAALFHDIGYLEGADNHEEKSAQSVEQFLSERNYSQMGIDRIKQLILVTNLTKEPEDLSQKIMKDADLAHLGDENYMSIYMNLRAEMGKMDAHVQSDDEWNRNCCKFMRAHKYYTDFAKTHLRPKKMENIQKLEDQLKTDEIIAPTEEVLSEENIEKKKKKKKKKNPDIPEKGIETMFRVSLRNHLNLSRLADNKANTLISVNAIIISIVLSALFPKLDSNPYLIYPCIILLTFTVATVIISILSTIPQTSHGQLSKEKIANKEGNILFFGNFHNMPLDDFEWGIEELMQDRDYLYKSLSRDLYFLGKVLHRKYKLLRISYIVFVTGLFVSISAFIYSIQYVATPL